MVHLTNHSKNSEVVAWLKTRDTREKIIPEIKNVLPINYATNHSFILLASSSSSFSALILHFCTARFKRNQAQ